MYVCGRGDSARASCIHGSNSIRMRLCVSAISTACVMGMRAARTAEQVASLVDRHLASRERFGVLCPDQGAEAADAAAQAGRE